MSFKSLGLSDSLLHAITKKGYTEPSPIQTKAIPPILERKDILASAQTGTGKTAGFTLPMLQILSESKQPKRRPIRALVLTPTRELAAQVYENVKEYSEFLSIESTVIFGGVNQNPQVRALRNGVDILVATPGRLLDLYNQRALSLSQVEILVLDEADRMLDMGFLRDIKKILALMPGKRQNLLFSATFSTEIKQLAGSFMTDPILVEATPKNTAAELVIQKVYHVDKVKKTSLVTKLISQGNWSQVLIFTRTKHAANKLSEKLTKNGIASLAIHGNKSQGARTKALEGFKNGTTRVLVATDIAARGLDIPLLPHVINFELPNVSEDYVHRIGRTGRAGASGEAISLVSHDEHDLVHGIEKLLRQKLQIEVMEGYEPSAAPPAPKDEPRRSSGGRKPDFRKGGSGGGQGPRSGGQGGQRRTDGRDGGDRRTEGKSGGFRKSGGGQRSSGGGTPRGNSSGPRSGGGAPRGNSGGQRSGNSRPNKGNRD
ncbi:ATP-dependent RNA helicase RhlE [Roseivirga ehrenbergii]|uniref:DEAD/DEAH box helicase n=1 Tax=Roseivirga ehrenbergii (strain DSM 102268 / JCM 13514 / KCTC 12282 / NCIMB 14502 / KMM 6017) TaxID=279360 RepID=UPI0009FDBAC5|nr:DEAD/DEAH box helicase [Roseivirga ehrenbergii]TCL13268.1 ATP-dependent RNA helicase RhlE [Roseivirga ehrenbergii]